MHEKSKPRNFSGLLFKPPEVVLLKENYFEFSSTSFYLCFAMIVKGYFNVKRKYTMLMSP